MGEIATARNRGFISAAQQEILGKSTVAIAGAGGDGGRLAVTLARVGVRRFRLADPEVFEEENLNRQTACNSQSLGVNKARAVGALVYSIAPTAEVEVFEDGVTESNVGAFIAGCSVVADETEFTRHELGIMVNRAARAAGVPVVLGLNVGFGTVVTSFAPDGLTFEEYLGLDPRAPLEDLAEANVELWRWAPVIPRYTEALVVAQVAEGEVSAPSVAPGVDLCGGIASTEILAHLFGLREPVWAPECLWFDAAELRCERITDRESTFNESISRLDDN